MVERENNSHCPLTSVFMPRYTHIHTLNKRISKCNTDAIKCVDVKVTSREQAAYHRMEDKVFLLGQEHFQTFRGQRIPTKYAENPSFILRHSSQRGLSVENPVRQIQKGLLAFLFEPYNLRICAANLLNSCKAMRTTQQNKRDSSCQPTSCGPQQSPSACCATRPS